MTAWFAIRALDSRRFGRLAKEGGWVIAGIQNAACRARSLLLIAVSGCDEDLAAGGLKASRFKGYETNAH